ncbi:rCG48071 [Rattus norvegicus]
MDWS